VGATNPRGPGLLLNTELWFPKWGALFAFNEAKILLPIPVEGHEASSPHAVVHSTVQNFPSNCNPHLEFAALKNQCMTHLNSPQRNNKYKKG